MIPHAFHTQDLIENFPYWPAGFRQGTYPLQSISRHRIRFNSMSGNVRYLPRLFTVTMGVHRSLRFNTKLDVCAILKLLQNLKLTCVIDMQFVNDSFIPTTKYDHQIFNGDCSVAMTWSRNRTRRIRYFFPFYDRRIHVFFTESSSTKT